MKKNKGITLVALVVTIIVLLILAAVSINFVFGENGVLLRAKQGALETEESRAKEAVETFLTGLTIEKGESFKDYILNNMYEADELFEKNGFYLEIGKDIIISHDGIDFILSNDNKLEKIELEYNYEIVEGIDGEWEYYDNSNGTITLTKYTGTSTDIVIPNYYKGKYVIALKSLDELPIVPKATTNLQISYGIRKIGFCSFIGVRITNVVIPDSVVYIGYAGFYSCNLSTINLSNNLYAIDNYGLGYNFYLGNVNFPDSLEYIGKNCFDCAQQMTIANLPVNLKVLSESAFRYCKLLNEVNIPGALKEISPYAFQLCESLTRININEGVETIGEYAFYNTKIIDFNLPSSVKKIGKPIFEDTLTVMNITVDAGNTEYIAVNNVLYTKDMKTLVMIPSGRTSITIESNIKKIEDFAGYCTQVANIQIPEGVDEIGKNAFSECKLSSISIPAGVKKLKKEILHFVSI